MDRLRVRVRSVIDGWLPVVFVLAVLTAGVGGWVIYTTSVAPGTVTQERTTTVAQADNTFTHSAQVSRENPLYPVGRRFDNRTTYLTEIAPVLNGTYTVRQRGLSNATVRTRATLVIRSAGESGTYWSRRQVLNDTTVSGVTPGEPVSVAFSLNVTRVRDRIRAIRQSVGSTPGSTSVAVVVQTVVEKPGGRRLQFDRQLAIGRDVSSYTVTDNASRAVLQDTRQVTTAREYGPLATAAGPLLLVGGLAATVGLVFGWLEEWFVVTDRERRRLQFHEERAEFDEWIVTAQLPAVTDRSVVRVNSLGDLVDVAIDAGTTVVEWGDRYVAETDDYRYVFHPPSPAEPTETERRDPDGTEEPSDERTRSTAGSPGERGDDADAVGDEDRTVAGDPTIRVEQSDGRAASGETDPRRAVSEQTGGEASAGDSDERSTGSGSKEPDGEGPERFGGDGVESETGDDSEGNDRDDSEGDEDNGGDELGNREEGGDEDGEGGDGGDGIQEDKEDDGGGKDGVGSEEASGDTVEVEKNGGEHTGVGRDERGDGDEPEEGKSGAVTEGTDGVSTSDGDDATSESGGADSETSGSVGDGGTSDTDDGGDDTDDGSAEDDETTDEEIDTDIDVVLSPDERRRD